MNSFLILHRGIAAVLLLLLFGPVAAKDVAPVQTATPALWKIEGAKNRVYLLGSVHVLRPELKWRSRVIDKAFSEAEVFVFEVDLSVMKNQQVMQPLMLKYGLLPQGQSLRDLLPRETYKELERAAAGIGMPVQSLDSLRPWMAAMMLSVQGMVKAGYLPENGVDYQADAWARAQGKKIGELETAESQLKIFAYLPRDREIEFLRVSLEQGDELEKLLGDMSGAYASGDMAAMEKLVNANIDEYPDLRRILLQDRHERWLPKIEKMIKSGRTHIVIVGAAHLVGPGSVVEMLRARGIKVEGP